MKLNNTNTIMRRVLTAMITALAVVMVIAPLNMPDVYAASGPNVTDHTQAQIRSYIESSGADFSDPTEYKTTPVNPTVRGELADSSKQSALKILNNIRYIAGLNPVSLNASQGELAQAAAFADLAVGKLTHTPDTLTDSSGNVIGTVPKPDGMSDEDWDLGNQGARQTNIAWNSGSINRAVFRWTGDESASNIAMVGHRRWMLNPKMGTTGFGAAGTYYLGSSVGGNYIFRVAVTEGGGAKPPRADWEGVPDPVISDIAASCYVDPVNKAFRQHRHRSIRSISIDS